jgi:hypothetical protein
MSAIPTPGGHKRRPFRHALYGGLTILLGLAGLSGITAVTAGPASAGPPSISGYATNFDVPDSTGKECEGFEVDIEDITPSQITYTWPGTPSYPNPYGSATPAEIQSKSFPNGHSGVSVTFKGTYSGGAWSAYTPIGQVNHFGVHVTGVPGVQTYTWLCDTGGRSVGSTGVLLPYGGTTTGNFYPQPSVPSIVPTVVPTPTGEGIAPVIVPAETPQPAELRLPDAVFVKKYRAMSTTPVDVNQLVTGDPAVLSTEANSNIASAPELFQPDPATNVGVETEPADPVVAGDQANVTVTETYHYTGPVDPADNSTTCNDIVGDPNNCTNFVGTLIARQMESTQLNAVIGRAGLSVSVQTGLIASGTGGNVTGVSLPASTNPSALDCGSDGGACLVNVDDPSTVTLKATPNAGYIFHGWSGLCSGSATICAMPVTGAKSVVATFVLPIVITSVAPWKLHPGQVAKVTLLATGILRGATLQVSGTGVSVSAAKSNTARMTAILSLAPSAALGSRDLTIRNKNGLMGICTGCLTVYRPTILGLAPSSLPAGSVKVAVALTGASFSPKATVSVSGTGVTVKAVVTDSSHIALWVSVASGSVPSSRDVTVTNKDRSTVTASAVFSTT